MTEEEKLLTEITLLKSLNYVHAYTGSLESLEQKSYVLYSDIIKLINEKQYRLKFYGKI